jgi:hypothetical protein
MRNSCKSLDGTPEGKSPLVKPRRIWEDNTKLDLQKIEYKGVN